MYQLVIGLRVYPGISKNPVLKGSKIETFERVYRSIINSLNSLNSKIVIFSDGCGEDFHEMIEGLTPDRLDFEIKSIDCFSGQKSFEIQYNYLTKCDSRLVALIEDDYLLDADALTAVYRYAEARGFKDYYTFFNSSDYYSHELHNYKSKINYFEGDYWRAVASTTLTFVCSPTTLKKNKVFFKTYTVGNFDHNIWVAQTKLGWGSLLFSMVRRPSSNHIKRVIKFILFSIILLPFVVSRTEKLWVCVPGKGTHLETTGCSYEYRPA